MDNLAPLSGIRVVDLGWLTAGAASATLLLDLGAEVIKIEGPGALDPFRDWTGAEPGTDWWNHSPFYNFTNRGQASGRFERRTKGHHIAFRPVRPLRRYAGDAWLNVETLSNDSALFGQTYS